jgi:ribonuclease J
LKGKYQKMQPNQQQNNKPNNNRPRPAGNGGGRGGGNSRGAAMRASKRTSDDAQRMVSQYASSSAKQEGAPAFAPVPDEGKLKIIGLGGMDGGGSKNMILLEYGQDALIIDCGNDLGVDLPGINYGICDTTYLESIRHKIKGYVITHGHLDHIGAMPHIIPLFPAPVYGSRFTIGRVEEIFQNFGLPLPEGFALETVVMNQLGHEKLKVGVFFVELVNVTHSIPGSTMVIVDTPVGRIVNTGDFRLDPNPLDHEKTDLERLDELGREGVLALLSESTTTERMGRTPSESTIEQTFVDIFDKAPGRVFVACFSTNTNRIQMVVNAAVHNGRKIVLDGRSMMSTLEMAVRNGFMKIPKGTFVPIASVNTIPDHEVVVICTGSQGEPNSALQRMSVGDHKHVKLKEEDTIVLSSTPIPETGNDAKIGSMIDEMLKKHVHVYRHETHDLDGIGPLHVSGHASIDEYKDIMKLLKPKYFIPIYGSYRSKQRHIEHAVEEGIPRANTLNIDNGIVVSIDQDSMRIAGEVPSGTILVDQTGALVSSVVVKDRLVLSEDGLVVIVLTVDKRSGTLMTSPDIISRGFIYMKDNEEMVNGLRNELRRAVSQRFKRIDLDRFKAEIKDHVMHYLFELTQRSPIVIPVVNVVGGKGDNSSGSNGGHGHDNTPEGPTKSPIEQAEELQKKYAQMRQQLLNQDARVD